MDKNKLQNNQPENDPISWRSIGFSIKDNYLNIVFKKTEKIVSALYLVSGLIKDEDPIKWELRSRGLDMLSASFNASNLLSGDKNVLIQSLFTAAQELISLFNITRTSGLISEMNHFLIAKEINFLVDTLRDRLSKSAENAGYVLSESFFRTSDVLDSESSNETSKSQSFVGLTSKGQKNYEIIKKARIESSLNNKNDSNEKKNKRQEDILNLLKERSDLSVKDFTQVIKDCSEKTVQRELLELVEKGVIKKQGERRWSRYSLN